MGQGAAGTESPERPRREIFVSEYLIDFNGTRAATAAGIKKKSAAKRASKWLKDPWVKKQIKAEVERRKQELSDEEDRIVEELERVGYSNMADFQDFLKSGNIDDLFKIPRYILAAVREVSYDTNGKPRVKLHPKTPAVELLGKRRKMFSDLVDHTGKVTLIVDM